MEEEEYLDDFAVDDVADGLGRCLLDEGEKESFAQFFLHLHFQIRVHKQFETFIINILPKKEQKNKKNNPNLKSIYYNHRHNSTALGFEIVAASF